MMDLRSAMAKLSTASTSSARLSTVVKPHEMFMKWCSENNLRAQYKITGSEQDKNVKFEISVPKYTYIGTGNAKTEETARQNALKDILLYLAQKNEIPTIPKKKKNKNENSKIDSTKNEKQNSLEPVVCGNWTVDTAYMRLKEFIKSNDETNFNIKIETIGRNFVVNMSIFIEKLNKTISTRETGKSKKKVMQKCELTLVNNLCTLGLIEHYSSDILKNNKLNNIPNLLNVVNVNEKLLKDLYSLLEDLKIKPMIDENNAGILNSTTLLLDKVIEPFEPFEPLNQFNASKVIQWGPPQSNWNPWRAIKINNPKPLTGISQKMKRELDEKKQHSLTFQKRMKDRSNLPIFKKKDAILDVIRENSVIIVHGGTGCGKTTQVCQFILEEYINTNEGANCNIICTQPRKVSAISIANRVSFERAEAVGKSVGYTVRFDSMIPQSFGAILFCTVEILIRKLKTGLFGITHVIVDEIHERRAGCELLLIILKDMVKKYQELKVILMSANANLNIFSKYFNNCPVIDVEGNCYPVKDYFLEDIVQMLNYTPSLEDIKNTKKKNKETTVNCNLLVSDEYPKKVKEIVAMISEDSQHFKMIEMLLTYIENNLRIEGAVLIFLPGWAWISELNDYLQQNEIIAQNCSILLLHSSLSHVQQHRVFKPVPLGKRKVILSTNIAETSITIDDVVFVIDYGKSKMVKCTNNVTIFDTVWASKVNVVQRRGRAGRVQEGTCFSLYTKERFNKMDDNILPELNHCSLNKIGLTIKLLNLGDIDTFLKKAIDPPPVKSVYNVIDMLKEMKCLDGNENLTTLGTILAELPVEPQLGRMMILGNILMLGESLSIIAAGSSTNYDLFVGEYGQNTAKHFFSGNRCSDQLAFLNAFMQWDSTYGYYSNETDAFGENNLSTSVLKATHNIKEQIINTFLRFGFPKCCFEIENFDFGQTGISDEPQLDMVSALLVMAFYPNIYVHKEKRKVNLKSKDFAVVSKSSVNSPIEGSVAQFQSPFFVFEQRISVMCMNSTMVTPIHILLFGAQKIHYNDKLIVLDDWIYLKMDVKVAAAIVALRPAIEDLIIRAVEDPKLVIKPSITDIKLIKMLRDLCNFNAGRNNLLPITFYTSKDENKNNKTEH